MTVKSILESAIALPLADRLDLLDQLDENVRSDPAFDPLTAEEKQLIDERLADLRSNPELGSSWEEVKANIVQFLPKKL